MNRPSASARRSPPRHLQPTPAQPAPDSAPLVAGQAAANQDGGASGQTRRCLMCYGQFASAWPGERICTKCKTGSAWRQGIGGAGAASRS